MSLNISEQRVQLLIRIMLFMTLTVIVVACYPPINKHFQYSYEIGKPWRYDLLTAEFDFPIYKPDEVIAGEREKLLSQLPTYLRLDKAEMDSAITLVAADSTLSPRTAKKISDELRTIYTTGIISAHLQQQLEADNIAEVFIIDDKHVSVKAKLSDFYTGKTAYEHIIKQVPQFTSELTASLLRPNVLVDSVATSLAQQQALSALSSTSGMIQSGEQIINRGDIVTAERYQVLRSLQKAYEEKSLNETHNIAVIAGEVIFVGCFLMLFFLYLYLFRPKIFNRLRSILCIMLLPTLWVGISAIIIRTTDLSIYIVPFAFIPIVIRLFFDSRTGLFTHWITVLLVAFMAPEPMEFIFLQVAAGMTAVSSLKDITQRSQLAKTSFMIFLTYAATYCALALVEKGTVSIDDAWNLGYLAISSLMLLTAYGFIYLLEKLFGFTSSITLVELTNVNSDLMLRFAEQAPGTFQHSLQVSNLATEAAKKINANSLLVRTGALYHDIGKMAHPEYFTENQDGGANPLNDMTLTQAAQTVINHVADGIALAKKEGLPQQIINFIAMHHGTGKALYFYNTYANQHPGQTIDPAPFTYPGPMPDSKETGILMMADAVEAASRSLQQYTEQSIDALVDKIVSAQVASGQLANTPLSFHDIEEIKEVFKDKIKNVYHHRIQYPELKR